MIDKLKFLVNEICKKNNILDAVEIIENSQCNYANMVSRNRRSWEPEEIAITFSTNPEIYIKYADHIYRIADVIKHYFITCAPSDLKIYSLAIEPDYEKISILNSEISAVQTPWEEINSLQKKLIENLNYSSQTIDYQNVGNTARTLMDKLARIVYDPTLHLSDLDCTNGKFKNQLSSYITSTLKGDENKELRQVADAAVTFANKSIDLMNQVTHKLDVKSHFAEICVISTIGMVNLLKSVNEIK